jgi:2-C-methyl-D-erythritol 4-phosphate cytidylyltransferase
MEQASARYAIIVAGGSGSRMNNPVPKQFLKLNGKPVLMQTINKFTDADPSIKIIIVLPQNQLDHWKELCREFNFQCEACITTGGETRFNSVKNGLEQIADDNAIVGVHDAARPLVNAKTINTAFKAAEMYGNAVPAVPLNDSIRQIESTRTIAVDRSKYCKVQTPQCFSAGLLKKAYQQEYKYTFTDDATVVESYGEKIHLIDGNEDNIKITTPKDLVIAEALMNFKPVVLSK